MFIVLSDKDIVDEILSIEVTQFDGQKTDLEELVSREKIIEIIKKYMPKQISKEWLHENSKSFANFDENGKYIEERYIQLYKLESFIFSEEEEQKYYVDLETAAYVAKWDGNDKVDIYTDAISGSDEFEFHLTENEIRSFNPKYMALAIPIEKM